MFFEPWPLFTGEAKSLFVYSGVTTQTDYDRVKMELKRKRLEKKEKGHFKENVNVLEDAEKVKLSFLRFNEHFHVVKTQNSKI